MVFKFGSVVEVIRPVDKLRDDAPKNFCFITFDKEEPARQLVFKGTTTLKGHQLVVSRVRSNNSKSQRHHNTWQIWLGASNMTN